VRESIAALGALGYEGWLSIEWEKRWHPELAEPELALPRELAALRAVFEAPNS
jgi:fatty-acyl-CoA synthase